MMPVIFIIIFPVYENYSENTRPKFFFSEKTNKKTNWVSIHTSLLCIFGDKQNIRPRAAYVGFFFRFLISDTQESQGKFSASVKAFR